MYARRTQFVIIWISLNIFVPVAARSDTLNGLAGRWQSWDASQLTGGAQNLGFPYWNNLSGDGPNANIGWCLIGGGSCDAGGIPLGAVPYYGTATGGSVSNLYFTSSGESVTFGLKLTLTNANGGANGLDVFGYYLTNSTGTAILSRTPLFTASSTIGSQVVLPFPANQNYGFYIENIAGLGTPDETDYFFYTNSSANSANGSMPADTLQHFAIFQVLAGTNYVLGTVDGNACQPPLFTGMNSPCVPATEFDYNDIVVSLQFGSGNQTSTPEPVSAGLVGVALLGVICLSRRKNRNRR